MPTNAYGQPIGAPVPDWAGAGPVRPVSLAGRSARIEPLSVDHADALWQRLVLDSDDRLWTYLPYGPFPERGRFEDHLDRLRTDPDLVAYALCDPRGAAGIGTHLRDAPEHGSVEIGHLAFGAGFSGSTAATEAMYLLARHVFDTLGYRRYEWKCDALNGPSWAAARRLGFVDEGVFRQAIVYKRRNRDTAWLSITDAEWPALRQAFEVWLAPENFDEAGVQRRRLEDVRRSLAAD